MNKLFFITGVILSLQKIIFCQTYNGYASYFFLQQQTNARAEALGRGHVTSFGDAYSAYLNPASITLYNGYGFNYSLLTPGHQEQPKAFLSNYGVYFNPGKAGAFALNVKYYSLGQEYSIYNKMYYYNVKIVPKMYMFTFSYAVQIPEMAGIGVNINYYFDQFGYDEYNSFFLDAGFIKRWKIKNNNTYNLDFGISITNLINSKVENEVVKSALPSILRAGAAYEIESNSINYNDFSLFDIRFSIDYQDVINSKYYTSINLGAELSILELIKLRGGYFTQTLQGPFVNGEKSKISEFTYGVGFHFPFKKLFKVNLPLNLLADYTRLPNPNFNMLFSEDTKYDVFSVSIGYDL